MTNKLTLFVDLVGRTIIGNLVSQDSTTIKLENPAIIHIQPVQSKTPGQGQVQVQVLPYLLPEFISADVRKEPVVWSFSVLSINVPDNLTVDKQLVAQYDRLFNPSPIVTPQNSGQIINLFDEPKK